MLLVLLKRFLGKRQSPLRTELDQASPEEKVLQIQQGDLRLRNQFITDYQPYIAKVTSRFCKRYIDPSRDDEFSIAINAFNEAVNQFSPESGRSFISFAETVIRRRLIDYVRKEQRFKQQIPYSSFDVEDDESNIVNPVEIHQAIDEYEKEKLTEQRKYEILEIGRHLSEFGISFNELVNVSPKHADSRESLFAMGRMLAEDPDLMRILVQKKLLPIKEMLEMVKVSRKTLERNRKFLIAVALIYHGPYPCLQNYLQIPQKDEERSEVDA